MIYEFMKFQDSWVNSPRDPGMTDEVSFQNRKYFLLPVYFNCGMDSHNTSILINCVNIDDKRH